MIKKKAAAERAFLPFRDILDAVDVISLCS